MKRIVPVLSGLILLGSNNLAMSQTEKVIELEGGEYLKVRDAGFVVVQYIDEGFGLTIESQVFIRRDGDDDSRPIGKADFRRACDAVLRRPEARVGGHPPDYVFFQLVEREIDAGLLKLRRTKQVYFETRTDRCRQIQGKPEEVK